MSLKSDVNNIGSTVLVVDDDFMIQALLTEVLIEEGYHVISANNGREAIALLERNRVDLVITDIVMPVLNGIEVLLAARRIHPLCPVIMITGYPSVESAVRLVNLGATDYITKPFNVDMIKLTVAKVLEMKKLQAADLKTGSVQPLAVVDGATGAYNLTLFMQLLENEIGRSELRGHVCSLLVFGFDSYGNDGAENEAAPAKGTLQTFADTLRGESRPGDVLARTDEAEFALILPETDSAEALGDGRADMDKGRVED